MGQYSGQSQWQANVYQYEQTDPVRGGADGISNKPLKDLADRTQWLKDQIGIVKRFEGEAVFNTNATIWGNLAGNLIVAYATPKIILTLDSAANFPYGAIIPITSYCVPEGGVVYVRTSAGQVILNPIEGARTQMYMHQNEYLVLVALGDHFKVAPGTSGNFWCAGEETKSRKQLRNTLSFTGRLLSRELFPRLWEFVDSLEMGKEKTTEATWLSHPTRYRGLYTVGDGQTTFRIPDERGTFERMLDLGRGLDLDRVHDYAGGYEEDEFKKHDHDLPNEGGGSTDRTSLVANPNADEGFTGNNRSSQVGGLETRPKNIGKLFMVKY